MRAFVEIVENMTGVVRLIIGALVLCSLGFGLLMTLGMTYVAPKVAQDYGERAERIGERAIAAAQEEARARALAEDGWGYGDPAASQDSAVPPSDAAANGTSVNSSGGWGDGQ
ncbi:hypothetical protein [Qipengyuania sp. ASV99]|uniref:hypothetical protein n=1 Tax=Qipengyuania sp. ASV99 TaxID=3399681 RepID=UPI003A4C753E